MARASEQFRQSDVTTWGLVALACGALAVFGANVSSILPQSVLVGLHKSRLEGFSMVQLRQEVADLRLEAARLRRDNEIFNSRFSLQEQVGSDVTRRVGALEVSVPMLIESLPASSGIDRSTFTAAIGAAGAEVFEADGGSVSVRQMPLPQAVVAGDVSQPLPAEINLAATAPLPFPGYGVAIGSGFPRDGANAQWRDLEVKLGSLLGDFTPLVADAGGSGQSRIVVGPFDLLADARDLCQRLEQIDVACLPTDYFGAPLQR